MSIFFSEDFQKLNNSGAVKVALHRLVKRGDIKRLARGIFTKPKYNELRATLRTGGINFVKGKWKVIDTDSEKDFMSFGSSFNLSAIYFGFEVRI